MPVFAAEPPPPIYTPQPQTPSQPRLTAQPVALPRQTKKKSAVPKIIGIAGAILICAIIGIVAVVAVGGVLNGNKNPSTAPINSTAIALGVQATQQAKIQLTEQASNQEKQEAIDRGRQIAGEQDCLDCHSIDGSSSSGPTLKGLFGSNVQLNDGTSITIDANFLRTSILNPNAFIISGYSKDTMPPGYINQISTQGIDDLVAYIISLGQ